VNSISLDEYQKIAGHSIVLERDRHGVKVLETPEGNIVKLFRRKRFFSSALLKSYSSRFVENAKTLKKLGFHTVDVEKEAYCKPIQRSLLIYRPIPGQTLRSALQTPDTHDQIFEQFIVLLAQLHEKGVLFRSIHLNNIIFKDIMSPLGLIDIADMRIMAAPLSFRARIRNFKHLNRYKLDQASIKTFGVDRFMERYFENSCLSESYKQEFIVRMHEALSIEGRGG